MLIVGNGKLVTRDSKLPFIENGALAIDGTKIVKVGTTPDLRNLYKGADYIDAKNRIIMPA